MTFALLEILIPLITMFGLGLGIGWLAWRWRRRFVSFIEWNELAAAANAANESIAVVEAEKAELANEKTLAEKERDEALERIAHLEAVLLSVDETTVDMREADAETERWSD